MSVIIDCTDFDVSWNIMEAAKEPVNTKQQKQLTSAESYFSICK